MYIYIYLSHGCFLQIYPFISIYCKYVYSCIFHVYMNTYTRYICISMHQMIYFVATHPFIGLPIWHFFAYLEKSGSSKGLLPIKIPRKLLGGQARRFSQFLDALWPVQWEKCHGPREVYRGEALLGMIRVLRVGILVWFSAFLEKVCGWCFWYSNIPGDIERHSVHSVLIKNLKGVDLKETWWILVVKLLVKLSFQADCSDRKYQRVLICLWWLRWLFTLPAFSLQYFGIQPVLWCHIFYLIANPNINSP